MALAQYTLGGAVSVMECVDTAGENSLFVTVGGKVIRYHIHAYVTTKHSAPTVLSTVHGLILNDL